MQLPITVIDKRIEKIQQILISNEKQIVDLCDDLESMIDNSYKQVDIQFQNQSSKV